MDDNTSRWKHSRKESALEVQAQTAQKSLFWRFGQALAHSSDQQAKFHSDKIISVTLCLLFSLNSNSIPIED